MSVGHIGINHCPVTSRPENDLVILICVVDCQYLHCCHMCSDVGIFHQNLETLQWLDLPLLALRVHFKKEHLLLLAPF